MKRFFSLIAATALLCSGLSAQEKPIPLTDEQWQSLAPTPPMGWNSWNKFGCNVSASMIMEMADAMVASGMKDAGYEYVVIDDCWQVGRDANGVIIPDSERFPDGMKAVADYVHSLGLKFGIYSCAGTHTCQGRPGSMGYQFIDAKTYADWGVDYLKYDWCDNEGQDARSAYLTMANAIKATGRPIVLSICEWGENEPWKWGKGIGHLWRVTPDIRACFNCRFDWGGVGVLGCIDAMSELYQYAGPGHWNDAEMLEVGNGNMSRDEQVTHFSMWCMLAAPLMSGNDLRDMNMQTVEILTNREAIAVNQDPLGRQAVKFMDMGDYEIWAKVLDNKELAVCFMNRGEVSWNLDYDWLDQTMYFADGINFRKHEYIIRDLWKHEDIGTSKSHLKAVIAPHACMMLRLRQKPADPVALPKGKKIYTEKDWASMDLNSPESEWSYTRMYCTDNIAIFWQKGFGQDPQQAPDLEGKPMKFSPVVLGEKLEKIYKLYYDDLGFIVKGKSNADKYRMNCYVRYELDGTAYGGNVDDVIGGLWVTPLRLADPELNVLAHELGHSFQFQSACDGLGSGGGELVENAAQWMLWQFNPNWQTSEKYHWEAWNTLTHKAFGSFENMYHSPYVLEYWSLIHGRKFIGKFFRSGQEGEDAVMQYKRMTGLSQEAFNDEMFDACRHFVNWDFERVWEESRPYANRNVTAMEPLHDGWLRVAASNCPERYGFNAVPVHFDPEGGRVTVEFRAEAGAEGYSSTDVEKAGYRYGFVCVGKDGRATYGPMHSESNSSISYDVPEGSRYLWLVVMGAPSEHKVQMRARRGEGGKSEAPAQFPYSIRCSY